MPSAGDVCPSCGKNPQDHPSISAGSFGSFDTFDDFDEPGGPLEMASDAQPLAAPDGPDVFGGSSFDNPAASIKLELDAVPVRAPARTPLAPISPAAGPLPPPTNYRDSGKPAAPESAQQPAFDPYEIAVLADYGSTPEKLWEYPGYALRVTSRRRELQRRLRLARDSMDGAERRRDDQLADLAERLRPELEASKDLESLLDTLKQLEDTAMSRQEALSARNQELNSKLAAVDQEIEAQRARQAEAKTRVDAATVRLEAARVELDRGKALLKRAEIELRNAQEVAREAAGPQARTAPPEHAAKLQSLSQILNERRAAVAAPQAAYDDAKKSWNDADTAHKTVERQIAELQKQRRNVEASYARELGVRSQGVEQAQGERRSALIAIGARLIEMNSVIVPRELRQAFFEAQDALSSRTSEAARLNQAIVSADAQAVKKGWLLMIGGGFFALVLLAVLVALLGRSEPEPLYGKQFAPAPWVC